MSEEKIFKCEYCDKILKTKRGLNSHIVQKHYKQYLDKIKEIIQQKNFEILDIKKNEWSRTIYTLKCGICKNIYKKNIWLLKNYGCDYCSRKERMNEKIKKKISQTKKIFKIDKKEIYNLYIIQNKTRIELTKIYNCSLGRFWLY